MSENVSMELDGIGDLLNKISSLGKAGERAENKALKKAGEVILEEAKNNVPIVSGKLKKGLKVSGIKKSEGNKYVLVGITKEDNSEIFYGKFLEFGTSKMSAKPFMAPAYATKKTEAKNIIKDELKKELGIK